MKLVSPYVATLPPLLSKDTNVSFTAAIPAGTRYTNATVASAASTPKTLPCTISICLSNRAFNQCSQRPRSSTNDGRPTDRNERPRGHQKEEQKMRLIFSGEDKLCERASERLRLPRWIVWNYWLVRRINRSVGRTPKNVPSFTNQQSAFDHIAKSTSNLPRQWVSQAPFHAAGRT